MFVWESLINLFKNSLGFLQYFLVPKAHHRETARGHVRGTPAVVGGLSLVSMLSVVEFDYHLCLEAAEVGEKVADGVVGAKLRTGKSAAVKKSPHLAFSVGLVAAQ